MAGDVFLSNGQLVDSQGLPVDLNIDIPTGGAAEIAVKEEGSNVISIITALNFIGASVTVTDGGSGVAVVTITDATLTTEQVQDIVGALVGDSSVLDATYDDAGNALTITISAGAVANSMLANMAQSTFKGRAASAGTGVPVDLTATQALAILGITGAALTASVLPFTPVGTIAATDTQAAVAEVATDAATALAALTTFGQGTNISIAAPVAGVSLISTTTAFADLALARTVAATSDVTRASTTSIADDSQLLLSVDANCVYEMTVFLMYEATTTGDFRHGFSVPFATTMYFKASGAGNTASSSQDLTTHGLGQSGSGNTIINGGLGIGTVMVAILTGIVVTAGTAGTLTYRWAQGASDATGSIRKSGSRLTLRRVA